MNLHFINNLNPILKYSILYLIKPFQINFSFIQNRIKYLFSFFNF